MGNITDADTLQQQADTHRVLTGANSEGMGTYTLGHLSAGFQALKN